MQMQQFMFYVQATDNVGTPNGINAGFHFRNDAIRHCQRDKGGRVSIVCGNTGKELYEFQRGVGTRDGQPIPVIA